MKKKIGGTDLNKSQCSKSCGGEGAILSKILMDLLPAIADRHNLMNAYQRVLKNKGAPGVDGMCVSDLKHYVHQHGKQIRQQLLTGQYQPLPVREKTIPKPNGGQRQLGIPTVLDRLVQQAILQVISPIFEVDFSAFSYGFRPGRKAADAVLQAREYAEQGHRWVVDLDLEKFFDQVNHDILMARLARRIKDTALLRLIRRFLEAGMLTGGLISQRVKGTPQGGPLSPLLSNIMLTDLDRELERRGHKFCRYADDCNIYVKSKKAGQRVLSSVSEFLTCRLKLRVNQSKSAVDRSWKRQFLGYSQSHHKRNIRLKVGQESLKKLKAKLKDHFKKAKGRALKSTCKTLAPVLRGWLNYYRYIGVKGVLQELDGWIRRHLRKIVWRQWKRPGTRFKKLRRLGLSEQRARMSASNGRGAWWNAGKSHMNQAMPKKLFDWLGLLSLVDHYQRLKYL